MVSWNTTAKVRESTDPLGTSLSADSGMAKPQSFEPEGGWSAGDQPLYVPSPWQPATTSRALFTVAGEQVITRAMWRNPEPSSAIRRHCSTCSGVKVGGRPTFFPLPMVHVVGALGQL